MIKNRTVKIKIKSKYKKLIIKLNDESKQDLTLNEIILAISKPYDAYTMNGEQESLKLFVSCLKDKNIERKDIVSVFNKYCTVEPWFKYHPEPDGVEWWIDEKEPFVGFAVKIKSTKDFNKELKSLSKKHNVTQEFVK